MAELGNINFVDVNAGVSPIDRRQEVAALDNALGIGKKLVDEVVTSKVTGDLVDAIAKQDGADAIDPSLEPNSPQVWPEGSRESHLQARVDKLSNAIRNGSVSQRTLAEMRLNTALVEAQRDFPWLYDKLQARAGQIAASSNELQRLGVEDAVAAQGAAAASKERQAIIDHGRLEWEKKGLGMPFDLDPADPQWIHMFTERQALRDTEQRLSMTLGMAVVNRDMDAYALLDQVTQAYQGPLNLLRGEYLKVYSDYGLQDIINQTRLGAAGDIARIEQWKTSDYNSILLSLGAASQAENDLYANVFEPELRDSPVFKAMTAVHNDAQAEIAAMVQLTKDIYNGQPGATEIMDTIVKMRQFEIVESKGDSFKQASAFITSPTGKAMLDIAASGVSEQSLTLQNKLAGWGTSTLSQIAPDIFGSAPSPSGRVALAYASGGAISVTPASAPSDINESIDNQLANSQNAWIVATPTERSRTDAATRSAGNSMFLWSEAIGGMNKMASPELAANTLTSLNTSFRQMKGNKQDEPLAQSFLLDTLAGEGLTQAFDLTADEYAGSRIAMATSAQNWYDKTDPYARRKEAKSTYESTKLYGTPLWELVGIDLDRMEGDSEIIGVIDEALVTSIAKKEIQRESLSMKIGVTATDRLPTKKAEVRTKVMEIFEPMLREANQQINIERNLDWGLHSVGDEKETDTTLKYYMGEEGDPLAWINIFRPVVKKAQ